MSEDLIGQAIVPTKNSPEDFTEAIEDNRTIVVTFYMPSPTDDNLVRSSIMTLQGRYRGQVEFFSYLYTDGQSYKDLVQLLQVNTTPTVVVINRDGVVQRAWTGYADEESLEQGIVEALAIE
jgi:thioredoxin-like negative regulator of GroEL